ncbi:squalene synthase HpnD [Aureimonas endophytica]|uniref:Squalene synthase HpnD n=1 Tax=Aureimonas endophytica TaxID=2027858 RepID=A0A917EB58_9HYPH|nr:presqualene diphosphate synthase HpnD [Aureimonas endophytica]GGE17814.1 squalene synthase HpnD [Aureimonas endophytica]
MSLGAIRNESFAGEEEPRAEDLPPVSSSFYLGLRILPREQRLAMYAVYAFCRAVDDVADTPGPAEERLRRLEGWRAAIGELYAGEAPRPSLAALAGAIRRFRLARADFDAIIAGMAMDVRGETERPDEAALDLYCDRVASAPGRLSVRVFGLEEAPGLALAHHLGRALQLTNILRDVDEDAEMGRLYLPRELLAEAGLGALALPDLLADPRLTQPCAILAERGRRHFAEARAIMDGVPRDRVRAPRLMAAAYAPLLERLAARGWAPPRQRIAKRKRDLMGAVLRFGLL